MDIANFIMNFLAFAAIIFAALLLRNYLPKYAEAKATNQATKEDIGEITDIVEGIKTELLEKTEELKAQLSLVNQHRIQVKTAEREAFFDYNKKLAARLYHLTGYSTYGNGPDNYQKMDEVFYEIKSRQLELDISEAHLFVFYRDQTFLELKRDLHLEILEYESIIKDVVFRTKEIYQNADLESKKNPQHVVQIRKEAYEKAKENGKRLGELRMEQFKKIHKLHYQMMALIETRLTKIEEEIEEEL